MIGCFYTKSFLYHEMEYGCKASGVKRIRVHDIRHSHASLLVEMGFPLLIAERLDMKRYRQRWTRTVTCTPTSRWR